MQKIAQLYKVSQLVDQMFIENETDDETFVSSNSYIEESYNNGLESFNKFNISDTLKNDTSLQELYIDRFCKNLKLYEVNSGYFEFITKITGQSLPKELELQLVKILDDMSEECLMKEATLMYLIEDLSPAPLHTILKNQNDLLDWVKSENNVKILSLYEKIYPATVNLIEKLRHGDFSESDKIDLIHLLKENAGSYLE